MNHETFMLLNFMAICWLFIHLSDSCDLILPTTLVKGKELQMTCKVKQFSRYRQIHWYRERELIAMCTYGKGCKMASWENQHRLFIVRDHGSVMTIQTLNKEDMVDWTCYHNKKSCSVTINSTRVKTGAMEIVPYHDTVFYVESFILVCQFKSYNEPVSWKLDDGTELVQCSGPTSCNRYTSADSAYSFSAASDNRLFLSIHYLSRVKNRIFICSQGNNSVKYNVDYKRSVDYEDAGAKIKIGKKNDKYTCVCIVPGRLIQPKIKFLLHNQKGTLDVRVGSAVDVIKPACFQTSCRYSSNIEYSHIDPSIIAIACSCGAENGRWWVNSDPIQLVKGEAFASVWIKKKDKKIQCGCVLPLFDIVPKISFLFYHQDGKIDAHLGRNFKVKENACSKDSCTYLSLLEIKKFKLNPVAVACSCKSWSTKWRFNVTSDSIEIEHSKEYSESFHYYIQVFAAAGILWVIIDTANITLGSILHMCQGNTRRRHSSDHDM